jgi:hypothetical protein
MSGFGNAPYDDSNRAFLQAFLARSTMTFEEAKPVLAAIFTVLGLPIPAPKRLQLRERRGEGGPP